MKLHDQIGFPWDAQGDTSSTKPPVLKRSRIPWAKQHDLFDPPSPRGRGNTLSRPMSLFNGRPLTSMERACKPRLDAIWGEYEEDRPRTYADCLTGGKNEQRPCPFVSCKYHLYLDVNENGALKLNFPGLELDDPRIPHTCALDAAAEHEAKGPNAPPRDFVAIGRLLNMTGAGAKKVICRAERRARISIDEEGIEPSWTDGTPDADSFMPAPAGNLRGFFDQVAAAPEMDPIRRQMQTKAR